MRSIMKKAVALVIVAVMLCMPVITNAAVGDPVAMPSNYISNGEVVTVEAGATTYFEIGTDGVAGTYDFVVEGSGSFTVSVCTEGSSEPYAEGAAVAATDGKVTTSITSYESTFNCAAFSITNNGSAAATYTCTVKFPEGFRANPKAITLAVGTPVTVTVPAGKEYWFGATLPAQEKEFKLAVSGAVNYSFFLGYGMPMSDNAGAIDTSISAYMGPATFAIINNTRKDQTYTLTLDNMPLGSEANPDTSFEVNKQYAQALDGAAYWYEWTAPAAGQFTFTIDNETTEAWTYNLSETKGNSVHNYSTGWGEGEKNTAAFPVDAGTVVKLGLSVPSYDSASDYWDVYTYGAGTINFSTTFVADEINDGTGDDTPGDDVPGDDVPGDDVPGDDVSGNNYVLSDTALAVGKNNCNLSSDYTYTVFEFAPDAVGKYTVSCSSNTLALVSTNGMWINIGSSTSAVADDVQFSDTFTWDCIGVGQSIWVAVSGEGTAEIDVSMEEIVIKEIPKVIYKNIKTPGAFTFPATVDTDAIDYVDTFDGVEDVAVLGEDGYYHLNTADGPILFVKLNESMMSLADARAYGQLKSLVYYGEEIDHIVDYNEAFDEYWDCADPATGYYPLTEDLIVYYKEIGNYHGWYGEEGWIGGNEADAWMFACYYTEDITSGDDITITEGETNNNIENNPGTIRPGVIPDDGATGNEGAGNEGAGNEGAGNEGAGNEGAGNEDADNSVQAPPTGDTVTVFAVLALLSVFAFAALTVLKRRTAK